jgi:3',5'-cyclic AMP phosphodiesterase CpdA
MIKVAGAPGSSSAFRFAYISDSHLFARGRDHRFAKAAIKAVRDVNALDPQPDFVLFGGDIAQLGRADELELGQQILSDVKAPLKMMVGEHDWYLDMGEKWRSMFGADHYSFDHKGVHFVVLNSVVEKDRTAAQLAKNAVPGAHAATPAVRTEEFAMKRVFGPGLSAAAAVLGALAFAATNEAAPESALRAAEGEQWLAREVWACDRRKRVVVEGVRPDEKIPPARAAGCRRAHGPDAPLQRGDHRAHRDRPDDHGQRARPRVRELGARRGAARDPGELRHASNTHPETYPKFQTQLKKVALLRDMVNWCILNPLEGKELAHDDPRMKALEAYILSERTGKALAIGKH